MSVRNWPSLHESPDHSGAPGPAGRCEACNRPYLPAKAGHVLCRRCWAVPPLVDRAAALLGLPPRETEDWGPDVVGLASALAAAMAASAPRRGGVHA